MVDYYSCNNVKRQGGVVICSGCNENEIGSYHKDNENALVLFNIREVVFRPHSTRTFRNTIGRREMTRVVISEMVELFELNKVKRRLPRDMRIYPEDVRRKKKKLESDDDKKSTTKISVRGFAAETLFGMNHNKFKKKKKKDEITIEENEEVPTEIVVKTTPKLLESLPSTSWGFYGNQISNFKDSNSVKSNQNLNSIIMNGKSNFDVIIEDANVNETDYSPTSPQLNANEDNYSPVLPRLNTFGEFDNCDLLAVTPSLSKSTNVLSRNNETTSEQNVIVQPGIIQQNSFDQQDNGVQSNTDVNIQQSATIGDFFLCDCASLSHTTPPSNTFEEFNYDLLTVSPPPVPSSTNDSVIIQENGFLSPSNSLIEWINNLPVENDPGSIVDILGCDFFNFQK